MASGNRKNFTCGHRGFGVHCHRCELADGLRKRAVNAEKAEKAQLLAEAERLKKPKDWKAPASIDVAG